MLFTEASRAPCKQPEWRVLHTEIRGEGHRLDFQLNVEIDSEGVTAKSDLGILSVRAAACGESDTTNDCCCCWMTSKHYA